MTSEAGQPSTVRAAIFLDRDGTLNFDYGWICSPAKIELLPNAAHAVREINKSGYLAIVVTNQPVIARGECSIEELEQIHQRLRDLLAQEGGCLDAIYYCPHHPDGGVPGERREYKIRCDCRKPGTGLLESAVRELNLDKSKCWMVGDSERDVGAAAAFGIRSVLVASNQQTVKNDVVSTPTLRAGSVMQAVEMIVKQGS